MQLWNKKQGEETHQRKSGKEIVYAVYKINMTINIDTIYCIAPVDWIVVNSLGFITNNEKAFRF